MSNTEDDFLLPIDRMVFGVRFQPRFEVLDNIGAVVDKILRSRGTPFGADVFPRSARDSEGHILLNPETEDELRIGDRDVVLQKLLATTDPRKVISLAADFQEHALKPLHSCVALRNIIRYGALFRFSECSAYTDTDAVEQFLGKRFPEAQSLSMRFTRKLPAMEALAKADVNDYRKLIYTIKQTENGQLHIWLDYQEYFDPELDESEFHKRKLDRFASRAVGTIRNEFNGWLAGWIRADERAA